MDEKQIHLLEDYFRKMGMVCPFCGSSDIEAKGKIEGDINTAWQDVVCNTCEAEWEDHFKLDHIKWRNSGTVVSSDDFIRTGSEKGVS